MEITEFSTINPTTNKLYILNNHGNKFLLKCYKEPGGAIRCEREKQMLMFWRKEGFHVPQPFEFDLDAKWAPCLVMEFLPGVSLKEHICSNDICMHDKMITLKKLFVENCKRHQYANDAGQTLLVHDDPNPGNILLYNERFYFLDFEQHGGHKHRRKRAKNKPIIDQIAVETTRLIRWLARDMGETYLIDIVNCMLSGYASYPEIPRHIITSITERPFQTIHRLKDSRKKKKKPGNVTKYDIIDALVSSLNNHGMSDSLISNRR